MKTIEQKYKELSEREHILMRSGMWIGSIKPETSTEFVYDYNDGVMIQKEIEYVPGMLKLVDEIVSNSCDEYRRKDNFGLTELNVKIVNNETIIVHDNGGIAVVKHKDAGVMLPQFIFGRLRTSSNYNDDEDRNVVGTNGVGSALTSVFSTLFQVRTADGKKEWRGSWKNNMETFFGEEVSKCMKKEHGTTTTFKLDLSRFEGVTELDRNFKDVIITRCVNAAVSNPGLKVTYEEDNDIKLSWTFNDFKDYIELYRNYLTLKDCIELKDGNKRVYVYPDGAINVGFVNGAICSKGTHIKALHQYINQSICDVLKKKDKIDVLPRQVDGNYSMFCDVTVSNPSYSSQTKEELTTPIEKFYKDESIKFELTPKFLSSITSSEIINNVRDWYKKKCEAEDQRAIRKINREISKGLKRPDKFITCTSKKKQEKQLWIFEGDSAKAAFRNCRDPHTQAGYIMRGVPKSAWNESPTTIMKNEVYNDLVTILGLKFGDAFNIDDLKFNKIVISSDMDNDGHHIAGILLAFFNNWPELYEKGIVVRSISPIIVAHKGKLTKNFYSMDEYKKEASKLKGWQQKFTKGLGGLNNVESKEMYLNPKFQVFKKDNLAQSMMKKWFTKDDSDTRKELLQQ